MPEAKGGASSVPPFPFRYSGPVLVCGSAACLPDDIAAARSIYADAPAIAVNAAAEAVKALMLFSLHPAQIPVWAGRQRRRFGDNFTTHSARTVFKTDKLGRPAARPDYQWNFDGGKGTSSWGARRLAKVLGFSPVVLCGVPLEPAPYVTGLRARSFDMAETVAVYRQFIADDIEHHGDVFSMSGWTREFFGAP